MLLPVLSSFLSFCRRTKLYNYGHVCKVFCAFFLTSSCSAKMYKEDMFYVFYLGLVTYVRYKKYRVLSLEAWWISDWCTSINPNNVRLDLWCYCSWCTSTYSAYLTFVVVQRHFKAEQSKPSLPRVIPSNNIHARTYEAAQVGARTSAATYLSAAFYSGSRLQFAPRPLLKTLCHPYRQQQPWTCCQSNWLTLVGNKLARSHEAALSLFLAVITTSPRLRLLLAVIWQLVHVLNKKRDTGKMVCWAVPPSLVTNWLNPCVFKSFPADIFGYKLLLVILKVNSFCPILLRTFQLPVYTRHVLVYTSWCARRPVAKHAYEHVQRAVAILKQQQLLSCVGAC